jgi:hypothetical protein
MHSRARGRKLFVGVPGQFRDMGEAHKRGLLATPEFGEGGQLQVALFGGRVALHGPPPWQAPVEAANLALLHELRRKFVPFEYREQ